MSTGNDEHDTITLTQMDRNDNINGSDEANTTTESLPESQSTWIGAAFNLTTVGGGYIGIGGAIAHSGGFISIISILVVGILTKYSFDLLVSLGQQSSTRGNDNSYEGVGYAAYGSVGKYTVVICKGFYAYGCTVAYIKIINDNFSMAASHFLYGESPNDGESPFRTLLENQDLITIFLCAKWMLPLCLLRDVSLLERASTLKVVAVMTIVFIVIYLYFALDRDNPQDEELAEALPFVSIVRFADHWIIIREDVVESLGTFVFTFVAQHYVHLVFQSLQPSQRNMEYFRKASTLAVTMSTSVSLFLGIFVYMTFWEHTSSNLFHLYPPSRAIDLCRLLLSISMLLAYPLAFLSVRELFVMLVFKAPTRPGADDEEKMLENIGSSSEDSWLIPGSKTQLKYFYHTVLTVLLWLSTLILALKASSLGAVLNLTGCAFGTGKCVHSHDVALNLFLGTGLMCVLLLAISYILPAIFSYKLRGHTILGTLLFVLGGSVGLVGTYYSILALF